MEKVTITEEQAKVFKRWEESCLPPDGHIAAHVRYPTGWTDACINGMPLDTFIKAAYGFYKVEEKDRFAPVFERLLQGFEKVVESETAFNAYQVVVRSSSLSDEHVAARRHAVDITRLIIDAYQNHKNPEILLRHHSKRRDEEGRFNYYTRLYIREAVQDAE